MPPAAASTPHLGRLFASLPTDQGPECHELKHRLAWWVLIGTCWAKGKIKKIFGYDLKKESKREILVVGNSFQNHFWGDGSMNLEPLNSSSLWEVNLVLQTVASFWQRQCFLRLTQDHFFFF